MTDSKVRTLLNPPPSCPDPNRDINFLDCYHGLLPRADIISMLKENGDYLIRSTEPVAGEPRKYVISCMKDKSQEEMGIKHLILHTKNNKWVGGNYSFDTIYDLVTFFHGRQQSVSALSEVYLKRAIKRQEWELSPNDIRLTQKLGEGAFGEVRMGILTINNTKIPVAVKLAKLEQCNKEQINEIMGEARLMRELRHENIIEFYGVCAGQEPLMVVMGLASDGSLDIEQIRAHMIKLNNDHFFSAGWGIEYLHNMAILHRDLAIRNCLYGNGKVKIADFGMSQYGTCYQLDPSKRIPVRWLAPEVLSTGTYTTKSEVWAYGLLCWEIYMNAIEPYPGKLVAECVADIKSGFKHTFPPDVKPSIAKLISEKCWATNQNDRLEMRSLVKQLHRYVPHARLPRPVERLNNDNF